MKITCRQKALLTLTFILPLHALFFASYSYASPEVIIAWRQDIPGQYLDGYYVSDIVVAEGRAYILHRNRTDQSVIAVEYGKNGVREVGRHVGGVYDLTDIVVQDIYTSDSSLLLGGSFNRNYADKPDEAFPILIPLDQPGEEFFPVESKDSDRTWGGVTDITGRGVILWWLYLPTEIHPSALRQSWRLTRDKHTLLIEDPFGNVRPPLHYLCPLMALLSPVISLS